MLNCTLTVVCVCVCVVCSERVHAAAHCLQEEPHQGSGAAAEVRRVHRGTTESGLTPLHVASFMGHMNIVIYLIQHGANIDTPTVRGETALHLAARANQTDIIRILLRNGAAVDARARVRLYK